MNPLPDRPTARGITSNFFLTIDNLQRNATAAGVAVVRQKIAVINRQTIDVASPGPPACVRLP